MSISTFVSILTLILIALKLMHYIDWTWLQVFIPFLLYVFFIIVLVFLMAHFKIKFKRK